MSTPTFSVLCHRYAAANPHVPWRKVCQIVSATLRPKKVAVKTQQKELWYLDK